MIVVDKDGKEVINTSNYENKLMQVMIIGSLVLGLLSFFYSDRARSNLVSNIMQWEKVEKIALTDEKSSILHAFKTRCLQKQMKKYFYS